MYPESLQKLIDNFKNLPGIGEKSAERLAFSLIGFEKERLDSFAQSIIDVSNKLRRCDICNNISESKICQICKDENRKKKIIFVVEKSKDVFLFEKTGIYNGRYHILDGLISPLEGIDPEDININNLLKRIKKEEIEELILALKPSIEGETTMQYIKKIINNNKIKITKIATGIPIGAEIEYIDTITLEMALEERKEL